MFTRPEDKKGQEKGWIPTTKFSMQLNITRNISMPRVHTYSNSQAHLHIFIHSQDAKHRSCLSDLNLLFL